MDVVKDLGISYKASYLIQGNQMERCSTSTALNVKYTCLYARTDGKDFNIESILKNYKGNIVFHLPSINPDLSNLTPVNNLVKKIVDSKLKLVTIDASNLSSDLFEWSTLEEQKKYFLNVVTGIATLASNKIEVAIENSKSSTSNSKFGSCISQMTDIIVYSRRLLVKDFGFSEGDAEKYIGISLNIDNINFDNEKEGILNYMEVFDKNIKVIKFESYNRLNMILDLLKQREKDVLVFYNTKEDLDEIKEKFISLRNEIENSIEDTSILNDSKKLVNNKGFTNIIMYSMILLTIVIVVLMFIIKLK